MKILIIGDIYGEEGKNAIKNILPQIKKELKPDITIANAENVSYGGKSLIKTDYDFLMSYGIDYITMGNHTFRKKEINDYIDKVDNMVRPENWDADVKGVGHLTFNYKNKKILLMNLLGVTFMNIKAKNPFYVADKILDENEYDLAIVDFHAETTSEKIVLGNYLSNKVGIFFGTHTHIQTADERILNNNQAYITDVGMTGVFNSAIGADFDAVTKKMKDDKMSPFIEAKGGEIILNGIIVEIDDDKMSPISIKRVAKKI